MDYWVDRPNNYKGLYGISQLLQRSHLNNFPLKTLKLGWVAFHSVTFQLNCLDFQSNQYKKLIQVLSRFGLCGAESNSVSVFKRRFIALMFAALPAVYLFGWAFANGLIVASALR